VSSAAAVRWANRQLGTREVPPNSNKGPKITQWEVASGYPWVKNAAQGVPWCQCFANAAAGEGDATLVADGYTPNFLAGKYRSKGYRPVSLGEARPGDFVYFKWPGVSGAICDHVGIFLALGKSAVTCVEGNTSPDNAGSQNNGGGVYKRTRSRGLVAGAVRVPYPAGKPYRNFVVKDPMLRGEDVTAFQRATNRVADKANRSDRKVEVDGVYGSRSRDNGAWAAFMLGIGESTDEIKQGGISVYVQGLTRNPNKRNATQKRRGAERMKQHSG
jgi:hypothetical protein